MKKLLNTLYVTTPDRYLSLDGENVVINSDGKEIARLPLHNLERIITFGYTGASPALMGKCATDGIELVFMSRNGRLLARIEGEFNGNVLVRRQQYRIADDPKKSLQIAKYIICAKIFNSRWTVERVKRDHPLRIDISKLDHSSSLLKSAIERVAEAESFDILRGVEGEAAQVYFSVFDDMILQQKDAFVFNGRNKRPPKDNVNSMLSFAYSLATSMCTSGLESVGLDPYVGFMHTDRPGRRSLALDLVEELRAPLCDRFVITLINKKIITPDDLTKREDGAVMLNEQGRRTFITAWQKRKDDELKHPFLEKKWNGVSLLMHRLFCFQGISEGILMHIRRLCGSDKMLVLITYDVNTENNNGKKRLRRVAKLCVDHGIRVQNSVFECDLTPAQCRLLKQRLTDEIDDKYDSLRFYYLGDIKKAKVEHIGAKQTIKIDQPLVF